MVGVFWFISLPLQRPGGHNRAWELLQEKTSYGHQLSSNHKLEVPELRVGTLDTLMGLSDDLVKLSHSIEAVVSKIRRTFIDVVGGQAASLKVEGLPVEAYLTRFKWDEPKYPTRRPLKETTEKLAEIVGHVEEDLKVKVAEFNVIKSQLSAAARKAGGSLAVRDVAAMVKPEQVVDSEHLSTLFVVVSKFSVKDWEGSYEKLCDFVVPRSTRLVTEDADYALFSVVLFKRVVDDFKATARTRGFQVREYVPPDPDVPETTLSMDALRAEGEAKRSALDAWCRTAYGEAFGAWVHLCVLRLFVESILRYGLPPQFQAVVVKPLPKQEGRLRNVLADTFGSDKAFWKDDGGAAAAVATSEVDQHPYVSLTLNTEST